MTSGRKEGWARSPQWTPTQTQGPKAVKLLLSYSTSACTHRRKYDNINEILYHIKLDTYKVQITAGVIIQYECVYNYKSFKFKGHVHRNGSEVESWLKQSDPE
jgi:hypothetical protein